LINIIKAIKKFKYYKDISLRQFSSLFFGLFTIKLLLILKIKDIQIFFN